MDAELPFGIDLDGTLAESVWPDRGIGEPIEENIQKLFQVYGEGEEIVIYTSRPWSDYNLIRHWLENHQLPYHRIVCGKMLFKCLADDRVVNASEDTWL